MCPNCFPASNTIAVGYIMALVICGLFFLVALVAMWWASRTGYLENLEDTKFKMLEDEGAA